MGQPQVVVYEPPKQVTVSAEGKPKKKRLIVGFVGMLLVLAGIGLECADTDWGIGVDLLGLLVLIFALVTGNAKFWG